MPDNASPPTGHIVALRPARPEDAGSIADVYWRSRTALLSFAPLKHTADEVLEWVTDWLVPSGEVVVAVSVAAEGVVQGFVEGGAMGAAEGNRVVGLTATSAAYGVTWLDQLYVDPDHAGQGVGTALLLEVIRRGPATIQLYTFSENTRARAFYERHGFVVVSEGDGSDNEEGVPDVLYRRPFDASIT